MVWIVGHRGSPTKFPENTFPSYEQALLRDGANALEVDICVTADDELLLWHDCHPAAVEARLRQWNLEPQTKYCPRPFKRPVREMTLALARESLGYQHAWCYLPTLGELFEQSHDWPQLGLVFIDVKLSAKSAHLVPTLLRALARLPRPRFDFVLECGEVAVASQMRRFGARHMLALDVWKKSALDQAFRLGVEWTCAQKPRLIQWPFPARRQRWVVENAPSPKRCAFTINDEGQMRALLALGVDAIQTDRPALLSSVVSSLESRSQPAFAFA